MNPIRQRINALRRDMVSQQLDAFYITGTDPHASEYLSARHKTREFITGFTGSYGQVVITHNEACLWTDSRYFIQAEEELRGSGITMLKLRVYNAVEPEEWLTEKLPPGGRVGFDPQTLPLSGFRKLEKSLGNAGIYLIETPDPFKKIWPDRPEMPKNELFELEQKFSGLSRHDKQELLREEMINMGVDLLLISAPDELAWIFNLRGSDIPYNPVFFGYGVVGLNKRILFTDPEKIPSGLKLTLQNDTIERKDYSEFFGYLQSMSGRNIGIDPATTSYAVFHSIHANNSLSETISPVIRLKSRKNSTELEGFRQAMIKDGIALTEFLFWLRNNVGSGTVTEYIVARKLTELRSCQEAFRGESFATIVGYKEHGAMIHLSVTPENALPLQPEGILLFDSGGHYLHGTTDVTRTVSLGTVTNRQKTDFTLVLKGLIALTTARFPAGTKGCNLDILARKALWENGLNYGHGTGHGVGHFLNVHEGPVSIRQELNDNPLLPGMILSNEPGIYREGEYGIRTENLILCVEKEITPFGSFLGFETLTLCPIDTKLIDAALLTDQEKMWLNDYHRLVRQQLTPLLTKDLAGFLNILTEEVS